ncbi:alpha/beta hydrolase [Chitinophaga sp. 212800010-3]|uniref:alpha/beta fold hydrolase n=1 Tax=unclassified Chitinophaga TaxID=2619133 RepID=UPI002DE2636D|nr:Pimeloyl-ACP methyl ester carboxylesterase [Chitinophaga sp. 212800010-3]
MRKRWLWGLPLLMLLCWGVFAVVKSRQETAQLNSISRKQAPGQFIQLTHGLVHYQFFGADTGRLLVLIHGGGTTGMEVWKYNIPFLISKGYRILAYDLYGRGYSDRPDVVYDLSLYREQLVSLLQTLGISGQFDVIAMSMGAAIGLDYVTHYPSRARHIVLLGPAASGDLQPSKLLRVPLISDVLMTCYWYPRSVENQRKEFVNQQLFNQYAERLKYFMNFEGYKRLTLSTWKNMLNQNQLYLLKDIPPNRILMIYGLQDPFFSNEKEHTYKSLYPTLVVNQVDSAGHMPHYEQPASVNNLIWQYLRETK